MSQPVLVAPNRDTGTGIDLHLGGFVLDQDRELLPFGTMRLREFADSTNVVNMAYSMEGKLVIAVASSALFDLRESDRVFREGNLEAYRSYQREHENDVLRKGVAFPLIRRLLALNDKASDYCPVDVVLLSRNDADTGLRVFKSIEKYGLDITRAAFVSGRDPFRYLDAFSATLFLSANPSDVLEAIARNVPAGQVFPTDFIDDDSDDTIRIAFDFDGVLADDSAESVFQHRRLEGFLQSEADNAGVPLPFGPLHRFFVQIAKIQERELTRCQTAGRPSSRIRTAIITARNAPAHERMITTLRSWGIQVDEALFLGGIDKSRVLSEFKPHIFFDDQLTHVTGAAGVAPCAHVPFGIVNGIVLTDQITTRRQPGLVRKDKRRENPAKLA